jgi:hypothetical protein
MSEEELPKVYVGIPTGPIKEYASLYMLASLRNIYYPKDKLEINIGITDFNDSQSHQYRARFTALLENALMPFPTNIHMTTSTLQEQERWGPYHAVIKNLHELRKDFLDKNEFEYFWLLGGDNPPSSGILRRLLALNVDYAGALISQRPTRGRKFDPDGDKDARSFLPIFWQYLLTPKEIRKRTDLEPKLRQSFLRAFTEMPYMALMQIDRSKGAIHCCNFGSGCVLIKRRLFEHIGYVLGKGYHSEDLHFGQWANLLEFETALDPNIRCAHFDPDGRLY